MAAGDVPGSLVGTTLRPPALEAEYRLRYLRDDGRAAATSAGGLALLASAFIATDAHFVEPPVLWLLTGLRVGQVAITAVLIAVALRTRRPAVLDAWTVAWVAWAALVIAVVQATRPRDYFLPLLSDLLLVVAAWALLPNRFRLQALAAAGSLTWLIAFRDRPPVPVALVIANSMLATISPPDTSPGGCNDPAGSSSSPCGSRRTSSRGSGRARRSTAASSRT